MRGKAALSLLTLFGVTLSAPASAEGHAHHLSVFAGATTANGDTNFTAGADYEYRLWAEWGLGVIYDHVFSSTAKVDTLLLGIFTHPFDASGGLGGLKIVAAPGREFSRGHSVWLLRVGTGYDVPAGPMIVTPTFAFDWIQGGHSSIVYGLGLGIGF